MKLRRYAGVLMIPLFLTFLSVAARPPEPVPPSASYYAVKVDGSMIGTVSEAAVTEIEYILEDIVLRGIEQLGSAGRIVQRIAIEPASVPVSELSPVGKIVEALAERVEVMAYGVAVLIDGNPVVILSDRSAAESIIADITMSYEARLFDIARREHGDIRELSIQNISVEQDIQFREGLFEPHVFTPPHTALAILLRGTDVERKHTVAPGESIWSIAQANNVSIEDLTAANPSISNPSRIRPGDELSLVVPCPYVNVCSTEVVTYAQAIPFRTQVVYDNNLWPWERVIRQDGIPGERLVTIQVTRRDGRAVETTDLDVQTVKEPRLQVVAQGSKTIPSIGSGQLIWPTEGRISSHFGWRRSGFHSGVDIAARTGTPVRAADAGVVTRSRYEGQYGNLIVIDHGEGRIVTYYAHLSQRFVSVGTKVAKGHVIGAVGSTGNSTGPHLHFEVRVNGSPVDPVKFFQSQVQ